MMVNFPSCTSISGPPRKSSGSQAIHRLFITLDGVFVCSLAKVDLRNGSTKVIFFFIFFFIKGVKGEAENGRPTGTTAHT